MKARTLLLMCGLALAGVPTAEPSPPLRGPDGWPLSPPDQRNDLRRRAPHKAQVAPAIPLPRPRPDVLEKTGAIQGDALNPVAAVSSAAPATPLAAPGPQNNSTPRPRSALLSATGQGVAGETRSQTHTAATPKWTVEPGREIGGAATPPISVRDAGGGSIRIEAHDASVGQVLAALEKSGLIRLSASDQLSRTVSGTYTGTLPQVLSRILDGYNYFLRVTASGTELHAFDASSDVKAAMQSGSGDANAASRSGSNENNAALPSGVGSKVEPATAPVAAFSLSPANPVSKARARVRVQQSAKTR